MIAITVRFLGGLREEIGAAHTTLAVPEDATVSDLEPRLRALGLDLDSEKNIVVLNDRGLGQWPPDRRLVADDIVIVFPHIAGGKF
jgi:molybdopterin converting factor small subunit